MVEDSLLLFDQLDPSSKSSQICNGLLWVVLNSSYVGDAFYMLDEMPEPDSGFSATREIVFGELVRKCRLMVDGPWLRVQLIWRSRSYGDGYVGRACSDKDG